MGSGEGRRSTAAFLGVLAAGRWHRQGAGRAVVTKAEVSRLRAHLPRKASGAAKVIPSLMVAMQDDPANEERAGSGTEVRTDSLHRVASLTAASRELYGIPELPNGQRLTLDDIRDKLIRQEETIIFALIERAQFTLNSVIYQSRGIEIDGYDGGFSDFLLFELEKVYARVRRYTSPDEHAFSPQESLPEPVLKRLEYPRTLVENNINFNDELRQIYVQKIVPAICVDGDDQNYGSSAVCDVGCLQALSKRIHYGKFVAEAKFQASEKEYTALIRKGDRDALWKLLTDSVVEERLLERVYKKACVIGQDVGSVISQSPRDSASDLQVGQVTYKLEPSLVVDIYRDHIIPLTKHVQVEYLLLRA
mmetsp:Transcript_2896/g.7950  ORF Transcript_2896/g.7950 Transcript_2896/m.7950 type:complete len:363 (+) Transcript_2896:99-1187(+)